MVTSLQGGPLAILTSCCPCPSVVSLLIGSVVDRIEQNDSMWFQGFGQKRHCSSHLGLLDYSFWGKEASRHKNTQATLQRGSPEQQLEHLTSREACKWAALEVDLNPSQGFQWLQPGPIADSNLRTDPDPPPRGATPEFPTHTTHERQ